MKVNVVYGDALEQATPLLALGTWEEESLAAAVGALVEDGDWSGKYKQTQLLYPRGAFAARRIMLVGLGKRSAFSASRLREVAALAAQRARELKLDQWAFELPIAEGMRLGDSAQALTEGAVLGLYRFHHYKTTADAKEQTEPADLTLVSHLQDDAIARGAAIGEAVARGVALARDLANGPSNDITPAYLGDRAQALGEQTSLQVTVLGLEELRQQGFGGILAVGQGSANEPRFIIMEHGAQREGAPTVCLVGKGITFDTGGISIKPAEGMDNMKMDMGGAAAVFGAMQVVADLNLPIHVVGLVSAAENMPSSTAYKPGDIVKTLSGKTIEVLNTDAEGRIVLADALFYAQRYSPAGIIDLATLTGAIMVALGQHAIGIMSNDDALSERVVRAGEASGERAWRLPLWEPYQEMVKSDIADVKNTAGRYGGAITAGAFLENFVDDCPWVHMDIAGTAWKDNSATAYAPKGATGVGVRLLVQALREWSEQI